MTETTNLQALGSTAGLDSRHWWMGGTFVTNIGADRMPVMREAVRRFGDSNIVLLEESQPPAPKDYGGCLHNLKPGDLSDFWQVVRDVDEESNKEVRGGALAPSQRNEVERS